MEYNYLKQFINFIVEYHPDNLTNEEKEEVNNLEKIDYLKNPTRLRNRLIGIIKFEENQNLKSYFRTIIVFLFKQKEDKTYEFYNEDTESFKYLHENLLNLFKESIENKIEKNEIYIKFGLIILNSKVNTLNKEMLQTCIYLNNLMNQSNYHIIENFVCFINKTKIWKIEESFKIIIFNRIDIKIKMDMFLNENSIKNINLFLEHLVEYKKKQKNKEYEQEAQKLFEYIIDIPKEKLIEIEKLNNKKEENKKEQNS